MADVEFHRLEDAARAAGVAPATLQRWLLEDRLELNPGFLVTRRQLRDALQRRGRYIPEAIEPWPKILAAGRGPEEAEQVYFALEVELPEAAVRLAADGDDALEEARRFRPDLVIIDAESERAAALCRAFAQDAELKRVRRVVIAPERDAAAGKAARDAGAHEVVHQPLTAGLLAETVRRLLKAPSPAPTA